MVVIQLHLGSHKKSVGHGRTCRCARPLRLRQGCPAVFRFGQMLEMTKNFWIAINEWLAGDASPRWLQLPEV